MSPPRTYATPHPWERRKGESDRAWEAFRIYSELPPGDRTCANVARAMGRSTGMVQQWSGTHKWDDRIRQRDVYLERIRLENDIKAQEKLRSRWLARLEHEAELLYNQARLIRRKTHQMIKFAYLKEQPFRKRCANCGEVYVHTIVSPVGWRMRDVPYMEKKAAEMVRMAFEMIGFKVEAPVEGVAESALMTAEDAAAAMAAIEARRARAGDPIAPDDIFEGDDDAD
jgi:hypothetical protein